MESQRECESPQHKRSVFKLLLLLHAVAALVVLKFLLTTFVKSHRQSFLDQKQENIISSEGSIKLPKDSQMVLWYFSISGTISGHSK